MEKYIINGHEVEYDTFDLENMELFDGEVRRISEAADNMDRSESGYLASVRLVCEDILDAFDTLLGEGKAEEIFGKRINAKAIPEAWRRFILDVRDEMKHIGDGTSAGPAMNRDQRRAAERERRRAEAKAKAAQRSGKEPVTPDEA